MKSSVSRTSAPFCSAWTAFGSPISEASRTPFAIATTASGNGSSTTSTSFGVSPPVASAA